MKKLIGARTIVALSFFIFLYGCIPAEVTSQPPNPTQVSHISSGATGLRDAHENLNSVLWMQTAAEHQISCQQIFYNARNALDKALNDPNWTAALEQNGSYQSLPPAIILDVDETVLDNSSFYGRLVAERRTFDFDLWKEWVTRAEAPPLPGAADFVFYAASKGVEIFYITNRDTDMENATRQNLARLRVNLPYTKDTVLMNGEKPGWTSDKSSRRAYIAEKYRILLLVGDDIGDFFEGANDSLENRSNLATKYRDHWARNWFLIPNPMYGSWEAALYGFSSSLSDTEVLSRKFENINYFGAPEAVVSTPKATVVPDMTVTFSGDKCTYEGPSKVFSGKITIALNAAEKGFRVYGLWIVILNSGKTMEDVKNWKSLDQPPWVTYVSDQDVFPGHPTTMSVLVTKGPLALVCFGREPVTYVGWWGPIEVVE